MKFLIFGSNKHYFKASATKNLSKTCYDLEETYNRFLHLASEKRYKYLYMIADFGNRENPKLFEATPQDVNPYYIPWVVIAFAKAEDKYDPEEFIKRDTLVLEVKGFIHTFSNNYKAIEQFEFYVDNHLKCDMKIRYIQNDEKIEEKISNSTDIIKNKPHYCRRYDIKQMDWIPDYIRQEYKVKKPNDKRNRVEHF